MKAVEYIDVSPTRKKSGEDLATEDTLGAFCSTNGQRQWLAHRTRPDIAYEQDRLAQRTSKVTVAELIVTKSSWTTSRIR